MLQKWYTQTPSSIIRLTNNQINSELPYSTSGTHRVNHFTAVTYSLSNNYTYLYCTVWKAGNVQYYIYDKYLHSALTSCCRLTCSRVYDLIWTFNNCRPALCLYWTNKSLTLVNEVKPLRCVALMFYIHFVCNVSLIQYVACAALTCIFDNFRFNFTSSVVKFSSKIFYIRSKVKSLWIWFRSRVNEQHIYICD